MTCLERSFQISALVSKVTKTSDPEGLVEIQCQLSVQNPVQRWVRFVSESPVYGLIPWEVKTPTISA